MVVQVLCLVVPMEGKKIYILQTLENTHFLNNINNLNRSVLNDFERF